jgi:hypothetical protein
MRFLLKLMKLIRMMMRCLDNYIGRVLRKFIKKYELFVVTTEFLLGFEPWKLKFNVDFYD